MFKKYFKRFNTELISLFQKIQNNINDRVEDTGAQYKAFGIFGIFNYPIYYFIWLYASPQTYESFTLRFIATILCLGLVVRNYWPKKIQKFLPTYWYLTLLYCLPFFFTFMLVKNHGSGMWITNTIVIVFFLMLLVDWLSCLFLLMIGTFFGGLLGVYFSKTDVPLFGSSFDYAGFFITYLVSIVIGIIFAHNKEKLKNERLRTIATIGESIAHELRTPLRTINSGARGIKQYLPQLIETYQIAQNKKLTIPHIDRMHCEALQSALENIEAEVNSAFNFISMLLVNADQSKITQNKNVNSIAHCINEALIRYPFDIGEKDLIQWQNKDDFLFRGDELLIIHVLFNLLKNALYYIRVANKGSIFIWLEHGENINTVHFKDTGQGISPKVLPHIFDRFFSRTHHGTGIGLAFCKLVMQSSGGDIVCLSKEGEFTEFILKFLNDPSLRTKEMKADGVKLKKI